MMPYTGSPTPNNQSYLDPATTTGRDSIARTMMNISSPPPQPQLPQMPQAGMPVPQIGQMLPGGAPPLGMPTPGLPSPSIPAMPGIPPQPQPGAQPMPPPQLGSMPGPRGY